MKIAAREQIGDFDIGVVAHNHRATIEQESTRPGRVYIRCGSFKGPDRYARKMGIVETGNQVPVTVLYPDRRES